MTYCKRCVGTKYGLNENGLCMSCTARPVENYPCKDCGKPTVSHWDSLVGLGQCHVCYVAGPKQTKKESE